MIKKKILKFSMTSSGSAFSIVVIKLTTNSFIHFSKYHSFYKHCYNTANCIVIFDPKLKNFV